jgi:hypothetical protein
VQLAAEIESALREMAAAGDIEVRENGAFFAPLRSLEWEVRGQASAPLLHLWSEQHNLTRRVVAVTEHSEERLVLAVQRFGRSKPDRLEFLRVDHMRPERELSREEFRGRLARLLAHRFPDETVESLSVAPDLEHSLSGCYVRGMMRRGPLGWAILGVSESESPQVQENILTFGLLWLERVRQSARKASVAGLRLFLPEGAGRISCQRLAALDSSTPVEVYEIRRTLEEVVPLHPSDIGNLNTWLVPRREMEALLAQARPALDRIIKFAPDATEASLVPGTREVALRFRGLVFARWSEGQVFFGVGEGMDLLTSANEKSLRELVRELSVHRHPLATDTSHPLYRGQAERWLETHVRKDPSRVDPRIDPRFVYAQVPAVVAGDRSVMDLLGVTRDARLVVMELKADEHLHLPLQAADYWLRVRWHQQQNDFARYGYFPGVELQPKPPLVYLVAPALRFHPSTDILLRFLSREMEVTRVGLAEDWRRGLRVIFRQ